MPKIIKKADSINNNGCVSYLLPLKSPSIKKVESNRIEIATKKTPACEKGA